MRSLLCILLLQLGLGACAQSFLWDGTFQPFFNIRNQPNASINDLHELQSGSVILLGNFTHSGQSGIQFSGITSVINNGSANPSFVGLGGYPSFLSNKRDSNLVVSGTGIYNIKIDTNGQVVNWPWVVNSRKTVRCFYGIPLFFSDGTSIMSNSTDNSGLPCTIVNPPDTFPGRHIIKLTPQGLWDSTFNQGDANYQPDGYAQYDSNRIMVYGQPDRFTHYNGVQVDGLCRVFLDGTLDTTFQSPLDGARLVRNTPQILRIEPDGKIYLGRIFYLKNHLNSVSLARLNPDGSLDSTFNNFGSPTSLNPQLTGAVQTIEKTPDGGYLVGGYFQNYQGLAKNAIAKIDSNGNVEPQYFSFGGPGGLGAGNYPSVVTILKSKFGGYYVGGTFTQWDGVACQPIVRLTDLLVGVAEAPIAIGAQGASVSVYPNPSNGIFTVKSEVKIKSAEVYDLMGSLVLERSSSVFEGASRYDVANATSLDDPSKKYRDALSAGDAPSWNLANFEPGIYFLKVVLDNGQVVSKKLIKQ
jgi:hypothetical protein